MKILIINNNTRHLPALSQSLADHEVEVRDYKPGLDFSCDDKDLIILSGGGGEGLEIHDEHKPGKLWYEDEMKFVLTCQKPIIGICMGFEIIARAYGSEIKLLKTGLIQGFRKVYTTSKGKEMLSKQQLRQFESHEWVVNDIDETEFNILGYSNTGIEIIKHKTKDIIATQFHPEKGGTLKLSGLLAQQPT